MYVSKVTDHRKIRDTLILQGYFDRESPGKRSLNYGDSQAEKFKVALLDIWGKTSSTDEIKTGKPCTFFFLLFDMKKK